MPRKTIRVGISRLSTLARVPAYATARAAGLDLCAAVEKPIRLKPGKFLLVPTGLAVEIPRGFEGQVRPRSGLALKHGISIVNAPGTIDSDYRGEVGVLLINLGPRAFIVKPGDRIAQMVIAPVLRVKMVEKKRLNTTARGKGGFGHTGVGRAPLAPISSPRRERGRG